MSVQSSLISLYNDADHGVFSSVLFSLVLEAENSEWCVCHLLSFISGSVSEKKYL